MKLFIIILNCKKDIQNNAINHLVENCELDFLHHPNFNVAIVAETASGRGVLILEKVINILNIGGTVVIFDDGRNFSQHCELLGGLRINIADLEMSTFIENNILASESDVLNYITGKACIDLTNLPKFIVIEYENIQYKENLQSN
jgi:hypothetical protein